jgi:hypothetical protein
MSLLRQQLAGVEDAVGVEQALDVAHQVELDRRLDGRHQMALEPADAVLGADRAAKAQDDVVDGGGHLLPARQNAALSAPGGWLTLKWILPSPMWPKGTGRAPGTRRATAALAWSMKPECATPAPTHRA